VVPFAPSIKNRSQKCGRFLLYLHHMEKFDILTPPDFKKSGKVKTAVQAIEDGDWLGTFNLWIIQNKPAPAIVYQQRSPNASWCPLKLDVTAGGHYTAGESIKDGLREIREELGKKYDFKKLVHAIFSCPIDELLKAHTKRGYAFAAIGLTNSGKITTIKVSKNSFPYNWDNYHFKIALLAKRFLQGEKDLLY
jgi:hypothetical protein